MLTTAADPELHTRLLALARRAATGDIRLGQRATASIRRLSRIPQEHWTPAVTAGVIRALRLAGEPLDPPTAVDGDALADTRAAWRRIADPQVRAALIDGNWHIKAPTTHRIQAHLALVPTARRSAIPDAYLIEDPAWAADAICAHVVYVKPEYDDALDEALGLPAPPHVRLLDGQVIVHADPSPETTTAMKAAGARWDGRNTRWTVPSEVAHRLVDLIALHDWRVHPDAKALIDDNANAWKAALDASVALDAPELVVPGLDPALRLRPFQRAGIAYMAAKRRTFNCDSPGLGKTLQTLATFAVTGTLPAVVVTKAALKTNWALREAAKAFPSWSCTVVEGRTPEPIPPADLIVINYDLLAARLDDLLALRPKGVAFDESHYIKTATSQRSKAAVALGRHIGAHGGVVLALTATPRPTRNYELWPQINALSHEDLFGSSRAFAMKYCGAKEYRVKAKNGGTKVQLRVHDRAVPAERDLELNEVLRANCMVVRHKNDVLPDLPPLELLPLAIDPEARHAREYARAKADIEAYAVARARQIAEEDGHSPDLAAWRARMAVKSNPDLVELGNLRRIAETMKVQGTLDFAVGLIADNPVDPDTGKPMKVLLFAHFRDVQQIYADRAEDHLRKAAAKNGVDLGLTDDPGTAWLRSAADQKPTEQDAIVDRFQSDPSLRILVCSAAAIAEGVTLTEASHVVLAHLPWNWSQVEQQAGRAYGRLNDAHGIGLWAPYVPDTIDEAVLSILERKREESTRVVQGIPVGIDDTDEAVAAELMLGLST